MRSARTVVPLGLLPVTGPRQPAVRVRRGALVTGRYAAHGLGNRLVGAVPRSDRLLDRPVVLVKAATGLHPEPSRAYERTQAVRDSEAFSEAVTELLENALEDVEPGKVGDC